MIFDFEHKDPAFPEHIVVKRSKRAKRLALRLDTQNRVFDLVVPERTSLKSAQRFAEENEQWMQDCLSELAPPIYLEDSVRIPILGHETLIQVEYDESLKRTKIALIPPLSSRGHASQEAFAHTGSRKDEAQNASTYGSPLFKHAKACRGDDGWILLVQTNQDRPARRIRRFLKKLAKEKFSELAHEKAALIDHKINDIKIRDTKSRWGSCSEDNNLNFSWRLIFAPYEAIDYVIAHEVAHLEHLDHSKAFWAVCRELSDDFIEGQYWMEAHGHELMRYV